MEIRLATVEDLKMFLPAKKAFLIDYSTSKKEREFSETIRPKGISRKQIGFFKDEFYAFLNDFLILAIDNHKVAGYLAGKLESTRYEKYGYIAEVFVRSNCRRKGLSSALKNKFFDILKERRIGLCRIEVGPGNPAEKVYLKWGFEIDKHRLSIHF